MGPLPAPPDSHPLFLRLKAIDFPQAISVRAGARIHAGDLARDRDLARAAASDQLAEPPIHAVADERRVVLREEQFKLVTTEQRARHLDEVREPDLRLCAHSRDGMADSATRRKGRLEQPQVVLLTQLEQPRDRPRGDLYVIIWHEHRVVPLEDFGMAAVVAGPPAELSAAPSPIVLAEFSVASRDRAIVGDPRVEGPRCPRREPSRDC